MKFGEGMVESLIEYVDDFQQLAWDYKSTTSENLQYWYSIIHKDATGFRMTVYKITQQGSNKQ